MAEEKVDVEYISLHGYIRNTPSDTEVLAEHQLRADQGDVWEETVVGNACGGEPGSHGSKAILLSHAKELDTSP